MNTEYNYQLLIKNIIQTPVVNNPDQEIIYRDLKKITYREFYKRVCRLANALVGMGIEKGDTVAVMDYDSHRYLECYFAVPMIGAVLHTVNIRFSSEQVLYTIDHAEDDVLFVHSDFVPMVEHIKGRIDATKDYVLLSDGEQLDSTKIDFYSEYEEMLEKQSDSFEFMDFDENTIATTFYTTGTTGMPKGVYFSHRQLVLHTITTTGTIASSPKQNFTQNDVYMPITPMFHVHAWGLPYIATFLGVKQVYPGKYAPDMLLDLIDKHKVTFSHCVPTILHMLLNSKKIDDIDLSKWKVIVGGASIPKIMCLEALNRGIDIFTGYGMSETCPIISLAQLTPQMLELSKEEQVDFRVKTGRPGGLVEIKIVDEYMSEVEKNGVDTGEVVVRAPWLTKGYLKDKKNSAELWRGGYLHTGDVANMKEDGYFKITDRTKDIIKVGGEWVSSLELEDIINQHSKVKEVAVVSTLDDRWGERPLALIITDEQKDKKLEKDILKFTKEFIKKGIMARESMLLKLKFIDEIDKTSVGKVNKKVLREKHS